MIKLEQVYASFIFAFIGENWESFVQFLDGDEEEANRIYEALGGVEK